MGLQPGCVPAEAPAPNREPLSVPEPSEGAPEPAPVVEPAPAQPVPA
jgi:hypothetical protein